MTDRQIAVVTGGAAGIGGAISDALAARGFHVVVADINPAGAEARTAAIVAAGGVATAKRLDVADRIEVDRVFAEIARDLGPVRRLVNNAGIGRLVGYEDLTFEEWRKTLAVNVAGALFCTQAAARQMTQAGGGRILNISSISGQRASPGRIAYGTTKTCIQALTAQIAFELAPEGILANCIQPGPVETELAASIPDETRRAYEKSVPLSRFAQPEEIGNVAAYLMADAPAFMTGAVIPVDGGFLSAGLDALAQSADVPAEVLPEAPRAARPKGVPLALVTGAARGIGASICMALAADGHRVIVTDRDGDGAAETAAHLRASGHEAEALKLDVSDGPEAAKAVADIANRYGRLDVLVNNAGAGGIHSLLDLPAEEWELTRSVNLDGPFAMSLAAARVMSNAGFGRILFISSVSGLRAARGRTAYAVTKAGVCTLARQFAVELSGKGVTVNTVVPGPIETEMAQGLLTPSMRNSFVSMIPAARMGLPEDIASAVRYLAAPEAGYVSGQTLAVDGGYSASGLGAESLSQKEQENRKAG